MPSQVGRFAPKNIAAANRVDFPWTVGQKGKTIESWANHFPLLILDLTEHQIVKVTCYKVDDPDGSNAIKTMSVADGIPHEELFRLVQKCFWQC